MIKKYSFCQSGNGEDLYFDDSRTVKELIEYAAEKYDYYIPPGIEIATLFQAGHHSASDNGWFTQDVYRKCCDEIENCDNLCFAYYLPGVFYYAEGGWGHHMKELGNHPNIPDPVDLNLRFGDFNNTVVINGNYRMTDIVRFIQMTGYQPQVGTRLRVHPVGISEGPYVIPFSDQIMRVKLLGFNRMIEEYTDLRYPGHDLVYYEIIEIQ